MKPNPLLEALRFSDGHRLVLIHTDDIGMCHASLAAYTDLASGGVISAGSTMVPCPWFPATADYCAGAGDGVDMGVHITLNSEWRSGYRWRPVSNQVPEDGLIDDEGYLPHTVEEVHAHATPEAVRREIAAQVERALAAGIDVTHIDSHMGTVFHPGFLESYIEIALDHAIPPFVVRKNAADLQAMGFERALAEALAGRVAALEAQGLPMFDDVRYVPFAGADRHVEQARSVFDSLKPGLTYLIIHPSKDTPELRAILPDGWAVRAADYEAFMQEDLRTYLDEIGVHLITWRTLRDLMRAQR